jgi:probable HAF family extracellular repeat protein
LGTLPGGNSSIGYAINGSDYVVGHSDTASSGSHGFLWDGTTMWDLNDLLDSSYQSFPIIDAYAINDAGQILAFNGNDYLRLDPEGLIRTTIVDLDPDPLDLRYAKAGDPNHPDRTFQVTCLAFDGTVIPPADCHWSLQISVAEPARDLGGHLQSTTGLTVHQDECRDIGALYPGYSEVRSCSGLTGGTFTFVQSTDSDLVAPIPGQRIAYFLPKRSVPIATKVYTKVYPIAGRVTFTVSCQPSPQCVGFRRTLALQVPGLTAVSNAAGDTDPYLSVRGKRPEDGHVDNQFAQPSFAASLRNAAALFRTLLMTSGLPPGKWPRMVITDIALPWGGIYDVNASAGLWIPPHFNHSNGTAADIRNGYSSSTEDGTRCACGHTCRPLPGTTRSSCQA